MVSEAQVGEQIVGAYHSLITDCEVVSYNQRSKEQGDQMEIDVIGINSTDGEQVIYVCEVITHLRGMNYNGSPSAGWWNEYGSEKYQVTIEKLWHKFHANQEYITDVFDDADRYVFEIWSPYVPEGILTEGLCELQERFERKHDHDVGLLINGKYSERVSELRNRAASDVKSYGNPAFRVIQILENLL